MNEGSLIVYGKRVSYIEIGDAHALPLVLLHDTGGSKEFWTDIADHFPQYRIIAFDVPYSIVSDLGKNKEVLAMANDIHVCVQALGLSNVVLVGHGFGAILAMTLARESVQWLKALIMVVPPIVMSRSPLLRRVFEKAKQFLPGRFDQVKVTSSYCTLNEFHKLDCTPTLLMFGQHTSHTKALDSAHRLSVATQKTDVCVVPRSADFPLFEEPTISIPSMLHWLDNNLLS